MGKYNVVLQMGRSKLHVASFFDLLLPNEIVSSFGPYSTVFPKIKRYESQENRTGVT